MQRRKRQHHERNTTKATTEVKNDAVLL